MAIVALLFIPEKGPIAGIGYWFLGLGFCAITAGRLIVIGNLRTAAH
jgi:hypothetical protein